MKKFIIFILLILGHTGALAYFAASYESSTNRTQISPWFNLNNTNNRISVAEITLLGTTHTNVESYLGVPDANGYVLSSTTAGVRSWVSPSTNTFGTNIYFRVYLASNKSISDTTLTKVDLNNEVFDVGGGWNTTTKRFEAPVTGKYYFHANGRYNSVSDSKNFEARLYKNGAQQSVHIVQSGDDSNPISINVYDILSLTAGQYVEFYVYNNASATVTLYGNNDYTYFEGFYLGE